MLSVAEQEYLLSLRVSVPNRTNVDYIVKFREQFGKVLSSNFISQWFEKYFKHKGIFKKPNYVPLDKFRLDNISKYIEFRNIIAQFPNARKFHFADKKHLTNKDIYPKKMRACPLTGRADCVPVSGNFRNKYNLQCIISADPNRRYPVEYLLGQDNGTSASFMAFIEYLIAHRWFRQHDCLILDNASIHHGGHSTILSDILWDFEYEDAPGIPLRVPVIYLPARAPELNPIELVFHILSDRLQSFRYGNGESNEWCVVAKTVQILNSLETTTVVNCCKHCGYVI
jgi:transposase